MALGGRVFAIFEFIVGMVIFNRYNYIFLT